MYDDFDRETRAAVLRLYRSVRGRRRGRRAARAGAARRSTARRSCSGGATTRTCGVEHAEREREAFPRAEVLVLDRAGHWPFVDDPPAVAAAVTSFLDRQAAPVVDAERAAA